MNEEIEKAEETEKIKDEKTVVKAIGKRKKRRKKKRMSFGTVIYYAVLAVIAAVVIIAMQFINEDVTKYLEAYENSLPKYEVERIFNEYFVNPDFDALLEMTEYKLGEYDKKEDIVNLLKKKTEGKQITYVYVAGTDKTKINVKADQKKFANFTIVKDEYPDDFGIYSYSLGKIELFYAPEYSVNALIPFNYSLLLNGCEIGEDYITEKDITDDERLNIPEGTYKLTYTRYSIKELMAEPTVTVKDRYGNEAELKYDEEKNEYTVDIDYSETLKAEYEKYVLEGMKLYAARMQNDAEFSQCKKYFEEGTDLYKQIRANPGSFVWEHDGYRFEDEYTGEYYAYDESTFRCHVKFNHILVKKYLEDHPDLVDMNVYFRKGDDGVYRIYAMETL